MRSGLARARTHECGADRAAYSYRVGELYSLIRFLGAEPFSYYYCKNCPCKSLHWKFSNKRTCDECGHTPMHHICYWNNEILKPIQKYGATLGHGKDAFEKLALLLARMMLRRTKVERADDMGLPCVFPR